MFFAFGAACSSKPNCIYNLRFVLSPIFGLASGLTGIQFLKAFPNCCKVIALKITFKLVKIEVFVSENLLATKKNQLNFNCISLKIQKFTIVPQLSDVRKINVYIKNP